MEAVLSAAGGVPPVLQLPAGPWIVIGLAGGEGSQRGLFPSTAAPGAYPTPARKGGELEMGVLRKNGSWCIDYRADGRRLREKIGSSKALAEKVLARRLAEIAEGKFLDRRKDKRYSFKEAAGKFLEYSLANKRSSRRDEGMLRRHLMPAFGAKYL